MSRPITLLGRDGYLRPVRPALVSVPTHEKFYGCVVAQESIRQALLGPEQGAVVGGARNVGGDAIGGLALPLHV